MNAFPGVVWLRYGWLIFLAIFTAPDFTWLAVHAQVVEDALVTDDEESAAPGHLVICGGGSLGKPIIAEFVELGGGEAGHLVVIPTASSSAENNHDETESFWRERGFGTVAILHTRRPEQANDPDFLAPLDDATAIWISGGQQSRLSDAYAGTLVEDWLIDFVAEGGVVGGTSAGAAIMSSVMIAGGRERPQIERGFELLGNAIVDQHFLARDRANRLLAAVNLHPDRMGIGIDEGTAIVVRGYEARVVGSSYVVTMRSSDQAEEMPDVHTYHNGDRFQIPSDRE